MGLSRPLDPLATATAGGGASVPIQATSEGAQHVAIREPLTGFGELLVAEMTPVVQESAVYKVLTDRVEVFTGASGTTGVTSDPQTEFVATCGTSVGGYGVMRARRMVVYHPGQANLFRIAGRFDSNPVALSTQRLGAFTVSDSLAFGYDGTTFGLLHEYGGAVEIQTLTITAAASGSETATVTLDGTAFNVSLTSGTAADTAYEIAHKGTYTGWRAYSVGDTVVFQAEATADKTGSFSLSSTGTAAGTFVETASGRAKTTDWVSQATWNRDPCDGTGGSGLTLDPSKINVYSIAIQYLGGGSLDYCVEDPATGRIILVHQIEFANSATLPSLALPGLRPGMVCASLGSTTDLSVHCSSWAAFVQGKSVFTGRPRSNDSTKPVGTTATSIIALQCRGTLGKKPLQGELDLTDIIIATDTSKELIVEAILLTANDDLDAAFTGTKPNFVAEDDNSIALYDVTASTVDTSQGEKVKAATTSSGGALPLDVNGLYLLPGETLIITARVSSGATSDASIAVDWEESF